MRFVFLRLAVNGKMEEMKLHRVPTNLVPFVIHKFPFCFARLCNRVL